MRYPEAFDKKAREWSVKYAGAPASILSKGTVPPPQNKPTQPKSKEEEQREQMARFDYPFLSDRRRKADSFEDTKGTTRI